MPPLPGDEDLRPSEVAPEAVRVTDRDDADPGVAGGVEARAREVERAGRVREVPRQVRIPLRDLPEPLDLLLREERVAVGGSEMAHDPDDVPRRLHELGQPPAAHAGVELDV